MIKNNAKTVACVLVGISMCVSSTVAAAATVPVARAPFAPTSISPFVALSAFGTMQSRNAVCGAAASAGQGCVLTVLDQVAPAEAEAAPVAPVAVAPFAGSGLGLGIDALLAGLVLVAGLAAVRLSGNDNLAAVGLSGNNIERLAIS